MDHISCYGQNPFDELGIGTERSCGVGVNEVWRMLAVCRVCRENVAGLACESIIHNVRISLEKNKYHKYNGMEQGRHYVQTAVDKNVARIPRDPTRFPGGYGVSLVRHAAKNNTTRLVRKGTSPN